MKITLDFNTAMDEDRLLLVNVMRTMSSALSVEDKKDTPVPAREDTPEEADHDTEEVEAKPVEREAEAEPAEEQEAEKPKRRTRRKKTVDSEVKSEGAGEAHLFAAAPDPSQQGPPAPEDSNTDLPFAEGEEVAQEAEPARQEAEPAQQETKPAQQEAKPTQQEAEPAKTSMTPVEFRAALDGLRKKLGVEPSTPESLMLSREISTRCETIYGTPKPSTLAGDKLAEFVQKWMLGIVWNDDHTGFEEMLPF